MRPHRIRRKTSLLTLEGPIWVDALITQDLSALARAFNEPLKHIKIVVIEHAVAGGVVVVFDDVLCECFVADHVWDGGAAVEFK